MKTEKDSVVFYSEQPQVWTNKNGEYHRIGGPAIIFPGGYQEWCLKGRLHRIGGPAVIFSDGYESWFLNGKKVTQKEAER